MECLEQRFAKFHCAESDRRAMRQGPIGSGVDGRQESGRDRLMFLAAEVLWLENIDSGGA